MTELHVFTNDYEWVVAESGEDARRIVAEMGGDDPEVEWTQEPDGQGMTIWLDAETGEVGSDGILVSGDMATWAEAFGRGYLCSTEF